MKAPGVKLTSKQYEERESVGSLLHMEEAAKWLRPDPSAAPLVQPRMVVLPSGTTLSHEAYLKLVEIHQLGG